MRAGGAEAGPEGLALRLLFLSSWPRVTHPSRLPGPTLVSQGKEG